MSNDWFDGGNWSAGVPNGATDATIDTTVPNEPVIGATGAKAYLLAIGATGAGTLAIQSGGAVSDGYGYIGYSAGSTGTVTVDGAGSTWTNSYDLFVGVRGVGTLTVQDGGAVSNADGSIGLLPGSTGTVTVDGSGSSWTTGPLHVGTYGTGTLTVGNGGEVSNTSGYIGFGIGSTGTVTVDGSGSSWTNAVNLTIGLDSTGALTIRNGGVVNVAGNVVIANDAGSTGALNIGAASGQTAAAPGTLSATSVVFGVGTGDIVFNHTASNYVFDLAISGSGSVTAMAGTTILTGASTYTGPTIVDGGELRIDGSIASAVTVNTGGTLGGGGSIANDVTINTGGTLSGGTGSTLTMNSLTMNSGSKIDVALGAPTATPLFDVSGDVSFYGVTLNITDAGDFGAGTYRLFNYATTLTEANGGITVGAAPPGTSNFTMQYFVGLRQINLVYLNGAELSFWDSGDPALHHNGAVNGGSGTWRADGSNWTQVDGAVNGSYQPNPTFAVFQNVGGVVTVDASAGAIGVTGMQFAADGYRVEGDSIDLQGTGGSTTIRVGDGTVSGASYTATIASTLTGGSQLVKNDFGTLILTGTSSYSGETTVAAGKLLVDGSIVSALTTVNSGGTLGGSGAVGPATIESGGTIAPGTGGISTLSVQGT